MQANPRKLGSLLNQDSSALLLMRVVPVPASLRLQIVETLRTAILEGKFVPGTRLVEREVCTLLNVSRTSVREAFRQLEAEGLVQTLPYRGRIVAGLSKKEARHLYEVRAVLEGLAGRSFVERASDEQMARLKAAFQELVKAAKSAGANRFEGVLDAKERFYQVLLEGSENPVAAEIMMQLNNRIRFLRFTSLSAPHRIKEALSEIRAIIEAVAARDADAAFEACYRHVQMASASAMRLLEQREDASAPQGADTSNTLRKQA